VDAAAAMGRDVWDHDSLAAPHHTDLAGTNSGYLVAQEYAGDTEQGGSDTGTTIYVKATLGEAATALATLIGEPHPLADDTGGRDPTSTPTGTEASRVAAVTVQSAYGPRMRASSRPGRPVGQSSPSMTSHSCIVVSVRGYEEGVCFWA
jgi:hypothetical protein